MALVLATAPSTGLAANPALDTYCKYRALLPVNDSSRAWARGAISCNHTGTMTLNISLRRSQTGTDPGFGSRNYTLNYTEDKLGPETIKVSYYVNCPKSGRYYSRVRGSFRPTGGGLGPTKTAESVKRTIDLPCGDD